MESKKVVLIVDDSKSFVSSVLDMLGEEYISHVAYTAKDALEVAERVKPHIVFLDIILPDKEGYEICSGLKKQAKKKPVEIILMSGDVNQRNLERILSVGADDFIRKPFDQLEFTLRLHAAKIRLAVQERLIKEREFYRFAVIQEESLTKKLLDQQFDLKETLSNLEKNRDKLQVENSKLLVASRYDVLTGLLNKPSLHARVQLEIQKAQEENETLYGIMIDIDGFKSINDSHGHLEGDMVLQAVGEALRKCLRKNDYAGRYGGDEFFVVLPGSEKSTALHVAERIKSAIEEIKLSTKEADINVSASIGITAYKSKEHMDSFIERADKAMYMAKDNGKNRITIEE